ncbi:MAG: biotin synthase BioB [Phycisphaerales bacterium]|jgi:biotin synthase|nr:biotin synthase BioB [Phycisphaerales bacterium]
MSRADTIIPRVVAGVLDGQKASRDDLLECARLAGDSAGHYELLYYANQIRVKHFADTVRLCSIGAGKVGACSEDCKWCAQSAAFAPGQKPAELIGPEELTDAACSARRNHASSFGIVNSGLKPGDPDFQAVLEATRQIEQATASEMRLCASLGLLTPQQAAELVDAGVTRYNHNLETSERMYAQMVSTHAYKDRVDTLKTARTAGMSLCAGGIFGIGETWADRIDMGLTLRDEIEPDVVPLNFLSPIPGTPLGDAKPMGPREILNIIAMYRIMMPTADIKIAGGREINLRDMQSWIFYAGATSVLIGNYLTTIGRSPEDDLKMISDLGLKILDR